MLGTALDLLLVIIGFGLIVFLHELGHFVAARWAGVRVLAFAMGFGPALVSYRKGMGFRRGSSELEHRVKLRTGDAAGVSPTEYRFNAIPFGGYVKMLGQDDMDPTAVSDAPDSYQNCPIWKRMVIISAGVVMNIILAAAIFMFVFGVGLRTEPAIVGAVDTGSPAQVAGLRMGDEIETIDGHRINSFNDVVMRVAMAPPNQALRFAIRREGHAVEFNVLPKKNPTTGLLAAGLTSPSSVRVLSLNRASDAERAYWARSTSGMGLEGVEPEMRLVRIGSDDSIAYANEIERAARESDGAPFEVEFADDAGRRVVSTITPRAELQSDAIPRMSARDPLRVIEHLAGLTPVLSVGPLTEKDRGYEQGMRENDVFARLGGVEYPSLRDGIAEVRAFAGKTIPVTVLRADGNGGWTPISFEASVDREGKIGFVPEDSRDLGTWVSSPIESIESLERPGEVRPNPAADLIPAPGTRVVAINGREVSSFTQLRDVILDATRDSTGDASVEVTLALPPLDGDAASTLTKAWNIPASELARIRALGWASPVMMELFEPEETLLKASGPAGALAMGLGETRRVMVMTYLTFARLAQGTVKVEHLKGPIGIAHLGTMVASRGFIWLLFFMALVSVNLAVINFMPIPITDGGQFLFLLWEQVRGKPAPIAVQNFAMLAGLVLIVGVFLLVTFNDIRALMGV
ncbi:MAG: site-2 protease family protein [Phycisphaerales bacterium]|jgi:regulator of sigma E protease|nr:site-2 protease family protein [Phycisphaerales bacterium]